MKSSALSSLGVLLVIGCTTGEGSGWVRSDHILAINCWDGPLDLGPTFFASDPYMDTQQIRIQRGDRLVGVSDGVLLVVNGVTRIRGEQLDQPIPLGLPIGVTPPNLPRRVEANPPQVSLSLYLNDSCHAQDPAIYSIGGTITFHKLFSGNRNENDADARLTDADFTALVTDPRTAMITSAGAPVAGDSGAQPEDAGSGTGVKISYSPDTLMGQFRFFFQRGQPAQPFP